LSPARPPLPAPSLPLPTRDGVGPSCVGLPAGPWATFLDFFLARFPGVSRDTWLARMAAGEVVDEHGGAVTADRPYQPHQRAYYYRSLPDEPHIPFDEILLFRDAHLLVVDKPHFLPMIPSGRFLQETLLVRLKKTLALPHLTPIHRLDRETAGVVIFSHNPATRGAYQSLFQKRAVRKTYEALAPLLAARTFPFTYRSRMVDGDQFFVMREEAGAPNSETLVELIAQRGAVAHYRLHPHTGRKHQLRLHMASLGAPIVNDAFYPVALPCKGDDFSSPLQLLARSIGFDDPLSGVARTFFSQRTLDLPPA